MKTRSLFEPLSTGKLNLNNRLAMAPMTRGRAGDKRFRNDWPLNPFEDMSLWYTPGPEGYTDYPPYLQGAQ